MRTIDFRGKDIFTGEWRYGMLVTDRKRSFIVVHMTGNLSKIKNRSIRYYVVSMHEVIAETVGQFTGLFDKKGNKIFEGDVIYCKEYYEKRKGVVVEDIERTGYKINWLTKTDFNEYLHVRIDNIEVINNIHDNPEL